MRIGADIGGTFTDVVLVNDDDRTLTIEKILTTPQNPERAVVIGAENAAQSARAATTDVRHLVHGSTLFTNALIERSGPKTALITTQGFRDAVEIAREHRFDMYDLHLVKPQPLAPRRRRFEVIERVLPDGSVLTPLNMPSALNAVRAVKQSGAQAVAVCLLHSYANPKHEQALARIIKQQLPHVALTLSCEVAPEIREYERTSTALCNVYVQRIAQNYLQKLETKLKNSFSNNTALYVMQSHGGLSNVADAVAFPIRLVESGPAAGALAAAHYGSLLNEPDVLSFDMGGTTAKASLIINHQPLVAPEFEVAREHQFKKGSGLPVKTPVIEMIEIGAGGGSIAVVDPMNRIQVGPKSAGADPGPAAYNLGGSLPTVTDADLVLGYLNPNFFLGGSMPLNSNAAHNSILKYIAKPLNISALNAAWGVHTIVNETMASAAAVHAVERGREASSFPLFAFGGAGPVHAYGVAHTLGCPRVIYPFGAGVVSALGFLTAPLAFHLALSRPQPLDSLNVNVANLDFQSMQSDALHKLSSSLKPSDVSFTRSADMRYQKQGFEIRVPLPKYPLPNNAASLLKNSFEHVYKSLYGHTVPRADIDVVSWRLAASGPKPQLPLPPAKTSTQNHIKGKRPVFIPNAQQLIDVPVYDRYALGADALLHGPAVIEERESTIVINGNAEISVDQYRNVIVRMPPK